MLIFILLFITLFLAYTNGANDNFKGVATLYGSNTIGYKTAITIATVATFLGSICAIFLAQELIASFSGKGLVPQNIAGTANFLIATGLGAGCTVLLATYLGFPISTTHSLVGGLMGAGVMAVCMDVNFYRLGGAFFIPLLVSPFIAFALGALVYGLFTNIRKRLGMTKESCLCIGEQKYSALLESSEACYSVSEVQLLQSTLIIADKQECSELYTNKVWGIFIQKILDIAHIMSAVAVSFARGLNDTPKIAGLLVAVKSFGINYGMLAIAIGMAIGGLLNARRVAETMSKK
ncbi:MAG: inorganic phosphate transporter [Methylococcales bacterium]|nr:inorganic phosphate transporter [Methylococcales bacterium]